MKRRRVLALFVALAGWSCGDGGGNANSQGGLQNVMEAIALDFAQVLADVAPSEEVFAIKGAGSSVDCPEGGTAEWLSPNQFGEGTLSLTGCTMRGINVSGSLVGFLSSGFGMVNADNMRGPLSISGGASADLNVQRLTVSAGLPIADETTFWEVEAIGEDGETFCVWSGGGPCQSFF